MSFSNASVADSSSHQSNNRYSRSGCCSKGSWSGINIAAMVIGFILFWPLGLVVLYWNITGRKLKDLPNAAQSLWEKFFNGTFLSGARRQAEYAQGENSVFDEYQQTQYDRIKEIKEEIKDRASRFNVFKGDVKRRAEEKEFKDFMSNNPDS